MKDLMGLIADVTNSGGISPYNGFCDPLNNPYGCDGGSGGSSTDPLPLSPVGLNPGIPVNVSPDNVNTVLLSTNGTPVANNLPTSSPGSLVNIATDVPTSSSPIPNPVLVIKSNPWLAGLAVGAGVYFLFKNKKRRANT